MAPLPGIPELRASLRDGLILLSNGRDLLPQTDPGCTQDPWAAGAPKRSVGGAKSVPYSQHWRGQAFEFP